MNVYCPRSDIYSTQSLPTSDGVKYDAIYISSQR